jgi:hypothetical protein
MNGTPLRRRGIRFSAKDLERGRKYMWREEYIPILLKHLDIRPTRKVHMRLLDYSTEPSELL